MTLTELAIKRPSLVVVFFAVFGLLGIYGYFQLNYNLLPKFSPPFVTVTTVYPGAAPSEVETTVSKVIEDAVSGIDKINAVITRSNEGASIVSIEFNQAANQNVALQDVIRQINTVKSQLPTGTKDPIVTKFAPDEIPIIRMGATSTMPPRQFYQFVVDFVKPEFSKLAGVGNVTLVGGTKREVQVNLDAQKIRATGLSLAQIQQAIQLSNLDFPTGNVKEANNQYTVRLAGKFTSVEELSNLIVGRSHAGGSVRLSDIGDIYDGFAEKTAYNRINNVESIGITIQKQSDANSVDVAKLVHKKVDELIAKHKDIDLNLDIATDSSVFTLEAAHAVQFDLLMAIGIVSLVMLLFLHSIRNSLIIMVAIPTSIISTMVFVWAFGFSLNLMTLLGLSLVIGILVDDSIVVLENIYHHMEKGQDRVLASITGRNEIGFAALSITLVDVAVFLPLSLVGGLVGNIMREFAVVVVISTLFSLIVSFTVTPILASRFAVLQPLTKNTLMGWIGSHFERFFHSLQVGYGQLIKGSLRNGWMIALVMVVSFGSCGIVPVLFKNKLINQEFFAQADRGEFAVTVEYPPSSKTENTNKLAHVVEDMLLARPEVFRVVTSVGTGSNAFLGNMTQNNLAEFNVFLKPAKERSKTTEEVSNEIKKWVMGIAGARVRVNPIGLFGTANDSPVQVVVNGVDRDLVIKTAKQVRDTLRAMEGTTDVRLSTEEGKFETRVELNRDKLASLGLNVGEVGSALRIALQGNDDVKYREGTTEYDVRIRLDQRDRENVDKLKTLPLTSRSGLNIELQQVADIFQATGTTMLMRRDRIPAVIVYAQPFGKGAGDVANELDIRLKDKLPPGVSYVYIGDVQNQRAGFGDMGIAMLGGIIFVYLIMVALYDSYLYPLVNLFSVIVAPLGAFLALAIGMKSMSIFTMLGFIMLIGLVMKNSILLVDRATHNVYDLAMDLREALIEAGETRLRPIVMTTIAMIFGMFPIAFSSSAGSEWKSGLAYALIGGLTSSMVFTLVLVPAVYYSFTKLKWAVSGRKQKVDILAGVLTDHGR